MAAKFAQLVALCFVHIDEDEATRTARAEAIAEKHPGARVVFRRGDVFTGWTETVLGTAAVGLVDPGPFPEIAEAYRKAEIPIFEPKPKKAEKKTE